MKFFTNKKFLFKLIVSICICLTVCNFGIPTSVNAESEAKNSILKWGGQLLQPIIDLVMAIGDAIINVLQVSIMGGSDAFIGIDKSANWWIAIAVALIAIVAIAAFIIATGGVGAAAAAISAKLTAVASGTGVLALGAKGLLAGGSAALAAAKGFVLIVTIGSGAVASLTAASFMEEKLLPEVTVLPLISFSPEEIFKGDILLFDVNFFNPKEVKINENDNEIEIVQHGKKIKTKEAVYYYTNDAGENIITSKQNAANDLKTVISKWYYALRNIAMVVLVIILIYVGIRILLTSVASDKAKYKQMLFDWFVAICLLFVIHFIMIFAIEITESVTNIIKNSAGSTTYTVQIMNLGKNKDKYEDVINEGGMNANDFIEDDNLNWPTNLMGYARVEAQRQDGSAGYIGYALCYVVLVMFTLFFAITYAKRLLYIAFLTVIAPLIAITYPIDKINDGKAQGFDMWIKEYIFNLLIQPLHLALYTVLITMAFDLAGQNIIYSIVAIGFMMPAEKFLRKMFNFEKAHTPGLLGGAAGAAFVMSGLNTLSRLGNSKSKNTSNASNTDKTKLRTRGSDSDKNFDNVMLGDDDSEGNLRNTIDTITPPEVFAAATNQENDIENPIQRMEREALEEKIADGQLTEDELTDAQRALLGLGIDDNPQEEIRMAEEPPVPMPEPIADEENDNDETFEGPTFKDATRAAFRRTISATPGVIGTGVRFVGGVTGATIGLAAGIAAGDLGSVGKNTVAGTVAGRAIGNIPGSVGGRVLSKIQESQEAFEREYYGPNYSKIKRDKEDLSFQGDNRKRQTYARELGIDKKYERRIANAQSKEDVKIIKQQRKDEIDKVMKQAIEYRKFGVTDDDIIINAMQIDNGRNKASKDKIASAMIASRAKNSKDVDEYVKRLRNQGVSENEAARIARNAKLINRDI